MSVTRAVRIELLDDHPDAGGPGPTTFAPARDGDAGIDLVACASITLRPGERLAVSAGIRLALPPGIEAQVRPRSGRALKQGLTVANAPGTIDPGYRGPVKVILLNAAPAIEASDLAGEPGRLAERLADGLARRSIRIERGERVAQLVFGRFERPPIEFVDRVEDDTERGADGFGSTGVE